MYLVIAGTTSARSAANRRSRASVMAPAIRNPPKTIANTNGTAAMATTFHRTGQLRSDQEAGRCVDPNSALSLPAAPLLPGKTARVARANIVTGLQRC
jgi:hypothetical protein